MLGVAADRVVGTVRIHEEAPGLWFGSRLAVDREFRRIGAIGATLIRLAVSSAHAMGCRHFLAHVQAQNGPLFRQMHWETLDEVRAARAAASQDARRSRTSIRPATRRKSASSRCGKRPEMDGAEFERLARTLREASGVAAKADIGLVAERLGLAGAAVAVGDDCAAIPDGDGHLLFAIEGFMNEFVAADPWFAGWCGVMVNLSDIAAMGGRPIAVVDAIWADGEDNAEPGARRPERRRARLWRADRRRPHQPAHGAGPTRGRRAGPRRAAAADEFRRAARRRPRARRRPPRRLSRAVRQLSRPRSTRRPSVCAAISRCSPKSPSAAWRARPRTSARAACRARRSCSRKARASRSTSISTRSSPPPGVALRTLVEDLSELRLSARPSRRTRSRRVLALVSRARSRRRGRSAQCRAGSEVALVSGGRRALLRDHARRPSARARRRSASRMNRPVRVAMLAHSTLPRGGVVHAMSLSEALTALGVEAVLHAPDARRRRASSARLPAKRVPFPVAPAPRGHAADGRAPHRRLSRLVYAAREPRLRRLSRA